MITSPTFAVKQIRCARIKNMRLLSFISTTLLFACPCLSAQVILHEDFAGTIPPVSWQNINANSNSATYGWRPGALDYSHPHAGWAWHNNEFSIQGDADNLLVSPQIDLTGIYSISIEITAEVLFSQYLANHPNSIGNGTSTIELTEDGINWVSVWSETSLSDGVYTECFDLPSGWGGKSSVYLGIRYTGIAAHAWWIDSITVKSNLCGNPSQPIYSISNLVAGGNALLTVTDATPSGSVLIGYSLSGAGPTMTPYGAVDMSLPIHQMPLLSVGSSGLASYLHSVPAAAAGLTIYSQALDIDSGLLSNSLAEVVQ